MTTHQAKRPTNTEGYSCPTHSHVFRDLRHRATCTQPSSRQPVTTTTTRSTALKPARDALTRLSHDAVAHQGHDESSNTHHSMAATPTRSIRRQQIEELFQQLSHWDTESLKSTRDAGPSGLHQHPGVEEQKARPRQWDTETPLGSRDADPSGSRRLWIDDSRAQFYHRDTVAPQGTRDADPLGSRHPRIDERILTGHSTTRIPERHEAFEEPVQQSLDACKRMIHHDEALRISLCTGITLWPPAHSEPKSPRTDTEDYYRRRCDEVQYRQTLPGNSAGNIISCVPVDAPSNTREVEGSQVPKLKPVALSDQADSFKALLPQPSVLRSYAFSCAPLDNKRNLSSRPDPTVQEIQKLMEFIKTSWNQDQAFANTLRTPFKASGKEQAFIVSFTEVVDGVSIKKYKFAPEYAELLARAIHLITNRINDYWKAAGTSKVFSFGWSSNYDMEFSNLIYRNWATRLVLNSTNDRLLARILLAKEVVEEFYSSDGGASNTTRSTATDPMKMQNSPWQAEDLRWVLQFQQDRSAVLADRAVATVRTLSLEQIKRQEDSDYRRHLNAAKGKQMLNVPQLELAVLSQGYSSSRDMNYRSRHLEAMPNLETLTTTAELRDCPKTSNAAYRAFETTTAGGIGSLNCSDNAYVLTKEHSIQRSITKAVDTSTSRHATQQEQLSMSQQGQDPHPRSTWLSCLAATGTTGSRSTEQAPHAENLDLPMFRNCDDHGVISSMTRPNGSWLGALLLDPDGINRVVSLPNDTYDCGMDREKPLLGLSWHGAPLPNPSCHDRVRSSPNELHLGSPERDISLRNLTPYLRQESSPSPGPQDSPYYEKQKQKRECEQEPHLTRLVSRDSSARRVDDSKELQRIVDRLDTGSNQGSSGIQNGSEEEEATAQLTRTKQRIRIYLMACMRQKLLPEPPVGWNENISIPLSNYNQSKKPRQLRPCSMLVSNARTRRRTLLLSQTPLRSAERDPRNDCTLPLRRLSVTSPSSNNDRKFLSAWCNPLVRVRQLSAKEITTIQDATRHGDGNFFLSSTSSRLTVSQIQTNEVLKHGELAPSALMGPEGIRAALGNARDLLLANKPNCLNHPALLTNHLPITFRALTLRSHLSHLTSAPLTLRPRAKDRPELYESYKETGSEGCRSLSKSQNSYDIQGYSISSKTFKGCTKSARNILEVNYRCYYSESWYWSGPLGRSTTYGFNCLAVTKRKGPLNKSRKNKLKELSDKAATWNLRISSYGHPKHSRTKDLATFQRAPSLANSTGEVKSIRLKDRRRIHKASSERLATMNHLKKAYQQRHSLRKHNWRKTVSHNWPADAACINYKETRIAKPQGEDEGYRAHNDTYYAMIITGTAAESLAAQTSKVSGSNTRQSGDHVQFTIAAQTRANHANRGIGSSKVSHEANSLEEATKFVMRTVGTASIRIFQSSVKSYESSKEKLQASLGQKRAPLYCTERILEHAQKLLRFHKIAKQRNTLPIDRPKELSTETYSRRSATARPDEARTILRKSDEMTRNDYEDLILTTTWNHTKMHTTEVLRWQQEAIRANLSVCLSLKRTISGSSAMHKVEITKGRISMEPFNTSRITDFGKETVFLLGPEDKLQRRMLTSEGLVKPRASLLNDRPSLTRFAEPLDKILSLGLSSYHENYKVVGKLKPMQDRRKFNPTPYFRVNTSTLAPYCARTVDGFFIRQGRKPSFRRMNKLRHKFEIMQTVLSPTTKGVSLLPQCRARLDLKSSRAQGKLQNSSEEERIASDSTSGLSKVLTRHDVELRHPVVQREVTADQETPTCFQSSIAQLKASRVEEYSITPGVNACNSANKELEFQSLVFDTRLERAHMRKWRSVTLYANLVTLYVDLVWQLLGLVNFVSLAYQIWRRQAHSKKKEESSRSSHNFLKLRPKHMNLRVLRTKSADESEATRTSTRKERKEQQWANKIGNEAPHRTVLANDKAVGLIEISSIGITVYKKLHLKDHWSSHDLYAKFKLCSEASLGRSLGRWTNATTVTECKLIKESFLLASKTLITVIKRLELRRRTYVRNTLEPSPSSLSTLELLILARLRKRTKDLQLTRRRPTSNDSTRTFRGAASKLTKWSPAVKIDANVKSSKEKTEVTDKTDPLLLPRTGHVFLHKTEWNSVNKETTLNHYYPELPQSLAMLSVPQSTKLIRLYESEGDFVTEELIPCQDHPELLHFLTTPSVPLGTEHSLLDETERNSTKEEMIPIHNHPELFHFLIMPSSRRKGQSLMFKLKGPPERVTSSQGWQLAPRNTMDSSPKSRWTKLLLPFDNVKHGLFIRKWLGNTILELDHVEAIHHQIARGKLGPMLRFRLPHYSKDRVLPSGKKRHKHILQKTSLFKIKVKFMAQEGNASGYRIQRNVHGSVNNTRKLTRQRTIKPALRFRRKLPTHVTVTCDRHPRDSTTLPPSRTLLNMSQYPHEHYRATITVDPTASSPAPVDQGPRKGYFDDEATRLLLSLDPVDRVLHSGTYGNKELSTHPIAFSTLRALRFDQRLLPFTPRNHAFLSTAIDMHEQNGQFPALVQTRKNLEEYLNRALLDAQIAGNEASINLPNYAVVLVPRFKYCENGDGRPFPYQFLVFFAPSATRMRGVRIGRVMAILDATTNCAHALVHGPGKWPKGEPVGIAVDEIELDDKDIQLLATFRAFGVPIFGNLPEALNTISVTPELARDVLIGKALGKTVSNTNLPTSSPDFDTSSGTNDDALYYEAIDSDHDAKGLEADGLAKTRNMRRDDAENAFLEELQDQRGEDTQQEPAPPYVSADSETGTALSNTLLLASTEQSTSSSGGMPPPVTSLPDAVFGSASEVTPSSAPVPEVSVPHPRKSTIAAQRSRNYVGPYTQPAPAASLAFHHPSRRPLSTRRYTPTFNSPQPPSPPRRETLRHYSPFRNPSRYRSPSPDYRRIPRRSPSRAWI